MNEREKAELLVECVQNALAKGCKHYDPDTKELLPDAKAILTCLAQKGKITVQEPAS